MVQHSSGARSSARGTNNGGNLEAQYFERALPEGLGGSNSAACFNRYHQTKLANSVFAQVLHEKLTKRGTYTLSLGDTISSEGNCQVKSLCAEPGVAATELAENLNKAHASAGSSSMPSIDPATMYPGIQSAADGACPLMEAVFGAGAESGDFYMPGTLVRGTPVGLPVKCMTGGVPTPTSKAMAKRFQHEKLTMSESNREILWKASEAAIGSRWELGTRVAVQKAVASAWQSDLESKL